MTDPNDATSIFDLEPEAHKGAEAPKDAKRFRIRIDTEHFVVDVPTMTGAQILDLVRKDPSRFKLVQRFHGGRTKVIKPDDVVDFRAPGVERFNTMAVDQTEGDGATPERRDFRFAPEDADFLDGLGLRWETISDAGTRWLVIYGYSIAPGYNQAEVDVALQIPPGYPDTLLDMAYFCPALVRADGRAIGATEARVGIGGRSYQRWSRHRTAENPWRPGIDCVATHMVLVDDWLSREFRK